MATLTVPGVIESLDEIADFVLEQARLAGLDKHGTYQLRLAVDELATNVALHGYQEHSITGDIVMSAEIDERTLTVVLEDSAVMYDPRQRDLEMVEDEFDKPLEERPIGGLGIFFVRQAVDDFQYEYRNGRNRNTLVIRRPVDATVVATIVASGGGLQ